ncbi:MAG: hypothetical protein KIT58_00020 [Planctomycetota bacterium]|nr:hypothetical protein [Planctomycetota bacterium]
MGTSYHLHADKAGLIVSLVQRWPRSRSEVTDAEGKPYELGNYDVSLAHSGAYAGRPGVWRQGRVERYPRERLSPYHLVLRALEAALGTRRRRVDDAAPLFGDPT